MGLDMYVYRTKVEIPDVGFEYPENVETDFKNSEVFYWRKHPNLHGWFKQLWESKGGKPTSDDWSADFNGDNVKIALADLDKLEADLYNLPDTKGFFFGSSYGDDREVADDRKFIVVARQAINDGYNIFYSSSW
jgi:hypothetical protein